MVGAGEATALAGCVCAAAPKRKQQRPATCFEPLFHKLRSDQLRGCRLEPVCCGQRPRSVFRSKKGQWRYEMIRFLVTIVAAVVLLSAPA